MEQELSAVSTFLASYLPRSASTSFPSQLEQSLATRYARHWHPEDPQRGSAYRALLRTSVSIDHDVLYAAQQAGLTKEEISESLLGKEHRLTLGERWTIWVDPGCVALRIDRGDGGAPRDGQFIEIYGKLPDSLSKQAVSLESVNIQQTSLSLPSVASSSTPTVADVNEEPSSPVKRSKAIQILPPPGGRGALQAMTNAALSPDSPAPTPARLPLALMASPLIIPPTPVRPLPTSSADGDVFSPTPAGSSHLAPPRSPSPRSHQDSLSPTLGHGRPSSPLGMPNFQRRPSSRSSSVSSRTGGGDSDGEASGTDSIFSAASSTDSLTTNSSTWKGLDSKSRDLVDADGFRVPALPMTRPGSTGPFSFPASSSRSSHSHSRGSSVSSLVPPPSPARSIGGLPRSQPGSPTKPRRRGVRGGQGRSESRTPGGSHHEHSASISSISSVTSSTSSTIGGGPRSPCTPSAASMRPPTPSSAIRSRTETSTSSTSTSALTATEYSNGLVKVLGGGVLLGCAKSCGSARATNTTGSTPGGTPSEESGRSRRGRERRRGGRGQGGQQQQPGGGANGAVSPMGSFSYPSPSPISPGIMHASSPVWYPSPRHV
ncbi:uncharacterized protein JCM6883_002183 [Sporobolomyces salmoneus]|uniref:uncharacterized protein n=1 Tax=Sporobolomyces salmoneus TaxID=183962 RepID=UPI00316AF74F